MKCLGFFCVVSEWTGAWLGRSLSQHLHFNISQNRKFKLHVKSDKIHVVN
jgi:hypothetical protein